MKRAKYFIPALSMFRDDIEEEKFYSIDEARKSGNSKSRYTIILVYPLIWFSRTYKDRLIFDYKYDYKNKFYIVK